ncbi:MAG: sterol desaturase family protein [Candidatus Doudnabacteria bacterium]|nr:sterol desaturase family protein [Candidatus Doudnabacteria bacterium]
MIKYYTSSILLMQILFTLGWFLLGVPFVEFIGYWVHRLVFHHGVFGSTLRRPHVQHHLEDYPPENLRPLPGTSYKSAADPLWHVIGAVILTILLVLILSGTLSLSAGIALALGSTLYAKYVVSIMHMQFHLPQSRLRKLSWFQKLVHYHDVHHYARANYGIVFMGMDRVFGTFQKHLPPQTHNVFPGFKI